MELTIDLMRALGYVSLGMSVMGLSIVMYHWRFFSKTKRHQLGKAMAFVFFSDVLMYSSIAAYGLNWVFMDGAFDFRIHLKAFQVLSIGLNLYALSKLMNYYKNSGE